MKWFYLVMLVTFAVVQTGCEGDRIGASGERSALQDGMEPVLLTDENFENEVLNSDQPVLVDAWAQWCQPCVEMKPTIRTLAAEFAGKVKVGALDVDANAFVAEKYGIERYPTLIVFIDGQEAKRIEGVKTRDELSRLLHSVSHFSDRPR